MDFKKIKKKLVFKFNKLGVLRQHAPLKLNLKKYSNFKKKFNYLKEYPKISIVTPSYNQGGFIKSTIESVLNQNYPNIEYIVQDGGSTDQTIEVLLSMNRENFCWTSNTDAGQADAINKGFEKTSGEIMAWLNSDDLVLPGTLFFIADFFQKNPEVDVIYGNRILINEYEEKIGEWVLPGHDPNVLDYCDYIPQETLFWRRSLWEKIGGNLDVNFKFAMDWDLLIRMKKVNANFRHIPRFLGCFRVHEFQKTSAQINDVGQKEMNIILKRIHHDVPENQTIYSKISAFLVRHIIKNYMNKFKYINFSL